MHAPSDSTTILIVDDDPGMRGFLNALLTDEGFTIETACNGSEGLSRAVDLQPQLIVSDRDMPGMDGLSMLKALREREVTRSIPFIFVSGTTDPGMDLIRQNFQVAAYIAKPFNIGDLIQTVHRVIDDSTAASA